MSYDPRNPSAEELEHFRAQLHRQLMDTERMTEEQATGLVLLAIETGRKMRDASPSTTQPHHPRHKAPWLWLSSLRGLLGAGSGPRGRRVLRANE